MPLARNRLRSNASIFVSSIHCQIPSLGSVWPDSNGTPMKDISITGVRAFCDRLFSGDSALRKSISLDCQFVQPSVKTASVEKESRINVEFARLDRTEVVPSIVCQLSPMCPCYWYLSAWLGVNRATVLPIFRIVGPANSENACQLC